MGMIEVFLLVLLLVILPWFLAMIDVLKGEFKGNDKLIFFLLVSLYPLAGPLLYFFVGKNQKIR